MLTIKQIRENYEAVEAGLRKKHFGQIDLLRQALELDDQRRAAQKRLDDAQAELNTISKAVGQYFREGRHDDAERAKARTADLKALIKAAGDEMREREASATQILVQIPNVPHSSVPEGGGADDNQIVRQVGQADAPAPGDLPHWELAKKYDIIDFELGVKITGAGFPVYKGKGARLQRGLISFFLDQASRNGFTEVQPPVLVNEDSGFGTGQLPDKEGQMYRCDADNLYLVPTAEVPVTNMLRDSIVDVRDLPQRFTAYTPCFRREAGSYGKDVRGLNRLHQFDKVEIVCVEHPDRSYQALDEMVEYVEGLVRQLELPYRILRLCGGDISFTSALTYDFEVWSRAQGRWLEVSSVSNFEAYQANRLKLRLRDPESKRNLLAHTLNGSALALPRIVAALLENNQSAEGIRIPAALVPYVGFELIE